MHIIIPLHLKIVNQTQCDSVKAQMHIILANVFADSHQKYTLKAKLSKEWARSAYYWLPFITA